MIPDYVLKTRLKGEKNPLLIKKIKDSIKLSKLLRKRLAAPTDNGNCERFVYHAQSKEVLPGILFRAEGDDKTMDREVNEAYDWSGKVREFFKEVLGIDSFNNKGADLISSTHYAKDYDNAFWDGQQMVYGDGSIFYPLTRDGSVVCHEFRHAVTQNRSNLAYMFESGALNEALSDIYAVAFEQWCNNQKVSEARWLIGADICRPEFGKALRSFLNEKAYPGDIQPKNYKNLWIDWMWQDNGGVHINSGIINHWFYLFSMKLQPKDVYSFKTALKVVDLSEKHLSSYSGFKSFKKAVMKVCAEEMTDPFVGICASNAFLEVGLK